MDLDISIGMLLVVDEHSVEVGEVLTVETRASGGDGVAVNLRRVEGIVGFREPLVDLPERARGRVTPELPDHRPQNTDGLGHEGLA